MDSPDPNPAESLAEQIRCQAGEILGPAMVCHLGSPHRLAVVIADVQNGTPIEDSILREAHYAAPREPAIADEFFRHFMEDLQHAGHFAMRKSIRRLHDTDDLVLSSLGAIWKDILKTRFDSRASYLSFLIQRMKWKASDKDVAMKAGTRRDDRRVSLDPDLIGTPAEEGMPLQNLINLEDRELLRAEVGKLVGRDRILVQRFIDETPIEEVATEFDLKVDSARRAILRAIQKLLKLLKLDSESD